MPALPTIQLEAMLLGWQRSHNGGSKVILQIPDEDLVHFEKMTVKKGRIAGQRLAAVFVEIGSDERPVPQPETLEQAKAEAPKEKKEQLGALSKWAVMRCQDLDFQSWVKSNFQSQWDYVKEHHDPDLKTDEERTKAVICLECGIDSRKELDTNDRARAFFDGQFRLPYSKRAA